MTKAKIFPVLVVILFLSGCSVFKKEAPRIQLAEGTALPAVSALAWLSTGESSDSHRFVSFTEDGLARTWEIVSGRMISICPAAENETVLPEGRTEFPVFSPDASKKLLPGNDGAVCLFDSATDQEIARYYGFGPTEWISIVPEGFYNASFQGHSFLVAEAGKQRYSLEQLSGGLFRPDLFGERVSASMLQEGLPSGAPLCLADLFEDNSRPPLISVSLDQSSAGNELKIKITEQKGGAGFLALYRRDSGPVAADLPAGLFDVEKTAAKKYAEKGRTCYEINLNSDLLPGPGKIGISAFNKFNTVESERHWVEQEQIAAGQGMAEYAPDAPVLRVLLGSGDNGREHSEALAESLSRQNEGDLYSAVELAGFFGNDFTRLNFIRGLDGLCAGLGNDDTLILSLRAGGRSDPFGNLRVVTGNAEGPEPAVETLQGTDRRSIAPPPDSEISGWEILEKILRLPSDSVLILLDLDTGDSAPPAKSATASQATASQAAPGKLETALHRFRQRLGPKAMLAAIGPPDSALDGAPDDGGALAGAVLAALNSSFAVSGDKYIGAAEILAHAGGIPAEQRLAFLPWKDFPVTDPLINVGELRFQTMTSGQLKIDRVDASPVPLIFGETMIRKLPAGSYIIDMFYRNGYRETRTVELRVKDNKWVVFTYTPALLTGAFPGRLSSGLINISELNPANYEKINKEAMEGMGMAPSYVAFLAGEKFYKDGDYNKAIAEYNRAISLKADYADAYVSRGNARRRLGDLNRAIEDYNRALGLKSSYAEVYNYRGFAYAKKGDLNRAIADYTQAIHYKADYADAYFNRAHASGEQHNWDRAIADYTQVIKLEPSNGIAYDQRGSAWNNKGDAAKAAADFAAAEKLGKR